VLIDYTFLPLIIYCVMGETVASYIFIDFKKQLLIPFCYLLLVLYLYRKRIFMYLYMTGSVSVGCYWLCIFGTSEINKYLLANFIKIVNFICINFGHIVICVNLTQVYSSLSLHSCLYHLCSSVNHLFLHNYIFY